MPIVSQLLHLSQKSDSDIEELLRRAKFVAMKLNLSDFEIWCESELMGYGDYENLPPYRITKGRLSVYNSVKNCKIPFYINDAEIFEELTTVKLFESIGQYLNLINKTTNDLTIYLNQETLDYLLRIQKQSKGYVMQPSLDIGATQLMSVITHVRNIIFNWSLDLEKKGILGEGMQFTKEEKVRAMTNQTIHIENNQGVVGNLKDSSVSQTNQLVVNKIDISTLISTLKKVGVLESDLEDLKIALNEDEIPQKKDNFGENVSDWYGKMISKAAAGGWEISVATAANLLTQLINGYYGLS